jgi:hypothetical protein
MVKISSVKLNGAASLRKKQHPAEANNQFKGLTLIGLPRGGATIPE